MSNLVCLLTTCLGTLKGFAVTTLVTPPVGGGGGVEGEEDVPAAKE
jgi:hypothetical protein